jgi:hypothetical protein
VFVPEQAVSVTEALRIPPSTIRDLKVVKTIVDGRVVYQAPATDGGAKTAGKPEPSAR